MNNKLIGLVVGIILPFLGNTQELNFVTHQGYLQVDSSLTMFNGVDYHFRMTTDSVYLPHRTLKIVSKEQSIVDGTPTIVFNLSDKSSAHYGYKEQYGHLFCLKYYNGKWMMWEKLQKAYSLNIQKDE